MFAMGCSNLPLNIRQMANKMVENACRGVKEKCFAKRFHAQCRIEGSWMFLFLNMLNVSIFDLLKLHYVVWSKCSFNFKIFKMLNMSGGGIFTWNIHSNTCIASILFYTRILSIFFWRDQKYFFFWRRKIINKYCDSQCMFNCKPEQSLSKPLRIIKTSE